MLARLKQETRCHHAAADTERLSPLASPTSVAGYITYLARIYGFEAPLEAGLARTPGLGLLVDAPMRERSHLLTKDLRTLGFSPARISGLARCTTIAPFPGSPEALGWMYVIERNVVLNAIVRRHLVRRMPEEIELAGAYLSSFDGLGSQRWRELGIALDEVGKSTTQVERVIDAAHTAFRSQHAWLRSGFYADVA
ncbi:MAG: bacteriophytochrome heme oxygenase [Myxococcales bacterium]|nr:bacteriophytochrome heme oxygenase [Myxococcales bacterium]